jgi:glyoxylase I family protein
MEKVSGIGGLFFRARDPVVIGAWYRDHLGVASFRPATMSCRGGKKQGQLHLLLFPETTAYFGDTNKTWMMNFRVRALDAMVAQLRGAGISVEVDQQRYPNGRFARLNDPERNPISVVGARRVGSHKQK